MATIVDTYNDLYEQVLEAFKNIQEPVLETVKSITSMIESILPDFDIEAFEKIPAPVAIVERSFVFVEQLMDAQKGLVNDLLDGDAAKKTPKAKTTKKAADTSAA